jgi:arsenate reductase
MKKKKVLFICTHNSARSQMAEGYLNQRYGKYFEAYSAGTEPTSVHPLAVRVMEEMEIDISGHRSKSVSEFLNHHFDLAITVCDRAKEACPFFPGAKKHIHAGFPDPAIIEGTEEEKLTAFREVRDQIISWIERNLKPSIFRRTSRWA